MSYITVEDLTSYQNKYVDEEQYSIIQQYVDAGIEAVKNYLGYDPEQKTYTTEEWGDDGRLFICEACPITSITSATLNGEEISVDNIRFGKKRNFIEFKDRSLFLTDNLYSFTYTAGFATVPAEIKTVALQIASLYWESAGGNLAVSSTSFTNEGTRVFNNFEKDRFLRAISHYRMELI